MANGLGNLGESLANITNTLTELEMSKRQNQAEAERQAQEQYREGLENSISNKIIANAITKRRKLISEGVNPGVADVRARKNIMRDASKVGLDASGLITTFNSSTQSVKESTTGGVTQRTVPGLGTSFEITDFMKARAALPEEKEREALEALQNGNKEVATSIFVDGIVNMERLQNMKNKIDAKKAITEYEADNMLPEIMSEVSNLVSFQDMPTFDTEEDAKAWIARKKSRVNSVMRDNLGEHFTEGIRESIDEFMNNMKTFAVNSTRLKDIQGNKSLWKARNDLAKELILSGMPEVVKRLAALPEGTQRVIAMMYQEGQVNAVKGLRESIASFVKGNKLSSVESYDWSNIAINFEDQEIQTNILQKLIDNNVKPDNESIVQFMANKNNDYSTQDAEVYYNKMDSFIKNIYDKSFIQLYKQVLGKGE